MELADEQFLSIKNETQKLNFEIEDSIEKGDLNIEFNNISLHSYLSDNTKIKDIVSVAESLGFLDEPRFELEEQERFQIFYSRLIETLNQSKLKNIQDLDAFIDKNKKSFNTYLKEFIKVFNSVNESEIYAVATDILLILLIMIDDTIDISNKKLRKLIHWTPLLNTFDEIKGK
ncbi:hypothetical protein BST97_04955 [Nonlabens spongiae]|uniref:Uncharacterized protein n=1 Tax=Nonlabens spongiae TaxID=331648 RepID=A0A1W6MIG5_9FLAO|nr:hypothetical protein [Nonlabens spongiae]ARN77382.1 hypothetical protein BST97_04955 [Nonlabens spongiae]